MSRLAAVLSIAAALAPSAAVGNAVKLYPVEEVRPLSAAALWGGDGRYDARIPYSRRSSQRQRRKLRRRGGR